MSSLRVVAVRQLCPVGHGRKNSYCERQNYLTDESTLRSVDERITTGWTTDSLDL